MKSFHNFDAFACNSNLWSQSVSNLTQKAAIWRNNSLEFIKLSFQVNTKARKSFAVVIAHSVLSIEKEKRRLRQLPAQLNPLDPQRRRARLKSNAKLYCHVDWKFHKCFGFVGWAIHRSAHRWNIVSKPIYFQQIGSIGIILQFMFR